MSHQADQVAGETEKMGDHEERTGLKEVFDILRRAPPERLISLTFQLQETPEDRLLHALTLIILQRENQALEKLKTLKNHDLAKHLAEKLERSQGRLEDCATSCAHLEDLNLDSLMLLARVFKVLSEQRLCDPPLRNLAYKRALSRHHQKTSICEDQAYENFREEAKVVCGFEEWMYSSPYLRSGSHQDTQSSLGRGSTALLTTPSQEQLEWANSLPSPLKANSMAPSYPSHLEISIPPTALYPEERSAPEVSQTSNNKHHISGSEANAAQEDPQSRTCESFGFAQNEHSQVDEKLAAQSIQESLPSYTSEPPPILTPAASASQTTSPARGEMNKEQGADESEEEEEEPTFYAFVILHAPVDADVADSMRVRLESIIGSEGATFSDDFATAGKSTLRCVEDAINNTAFTVLLLTRNFNTHMQDLETNSALLNSVNKTHKHNTVIPLLPQHNSMPRQDISMILQTIIPLVEDRNFERKVLRAMSKTAIRRQHKIWLEEQKVKGQIKKQERLRRQKQHNKQFIRERERAQLLEKENIVLTQRLLLGCPMSMQNDGEQCRAWWQQQPQQQPNIHINNAKYIMIGNDSQMTVDLGGGVDLNDSEGREGDGGE